MPVMLPPAAGYLWKSRRRMSASGLVTWERCPRQWFYSRRIGVAQPQNPPMLVGHVAEEAVGERPQQPTAQTRTRQRAAIAKAFVKPPGDHKRSGKGFGNDRPGVFRQPSVRV